MISVDEFKRAWKEIEIEEAKRGFLVHFLAYLIVNTFLTLVYYFSTRNIIFSPWVIFGWGMGLTFHFVFSRERFVIPKWESKVARVEMRAREMKK